MRKTCTRCITTVGLSMSLLTTAHAAPFLNGSFEDSTGITPGTNVDGPTTNTDITGWTLNVPAGARARYAADFFGFIDPSDGNDQIVFNNGNLDGGASISQSFDTVIGLVYTVTFDAGFIDTANLNTGSLDLLASVDTLLGESEAVSFDISGPAGSNGSGTYTTDFGFSFVATDTTTTLTFLDTTADAAGNGADLALDNVRVTVIPEPASLALLGVGGLLVAARRRRAELSN